VQGASRLVTERAALLYFATQAAQLLLAPQEATLRQEVLDLAQARYGMDRQELQKFLEPISNQIEEFAVLLHVDIGTCERSTTILMTASEELAQLTIESSTAQQRTDQEKNLAEQQAKHWRQKASRWRREVIRDPLTGVYNRRFLEEALDTELKRARRRCTLLGLLFIDLDSFKLLNDQLGHLAGDRALKEVGATLRQQVRAGDLVARYGGDEFCVLVEDISEEGIRCLAERLAEAIRALMPDPEVAAVRLGASVGAVICAPYRSNLDSVQLLAQADEAMYAAKNAGKGRVIFLSLLLPQDSHFLEGVRQRLFSVHLVQRELVTTGQMSQVARRVPMVRYPLGRLARKLSWLRPGQLRQILQEQRRTKNLFGECALALGHLTSAQLASLLALQREYPEELAQSLIDLHILTKRQAREELRAYYQALQAGESSQPALS
jgi:diguanylate cyclase (GGDEF)-like protein